VAKNFYNWLGYYWQSSRQQISRVQFYLGHCVCCSVSVWVYCHWIHDDEPLPSPIFIHADDLVRRRRFASRETAQSL